MQCNFFNLYKNERRASFRNGKVYPYTLEFECAINESKILKLTEADANKYCIGENFLECPRLKVHERFKTK
jgi:hypothetical protein